MAVDDTDDPRGKIAGQYKVFWNDVSPKRVVILQFPSKHQSEPYNNARNSKPIRMRMKPNSGYIEVEVPLNTAGTPFHHKENALLFGEDLQGNRTLQQNGSLGMAGGFGTSVTGRRGRPATSNTADEDMVDAHDMDSDERYEHAERSGRLMKTLTLSGMVRMYQPGDSQYAIATFRGDELHFTRVDGICSLSPNYTHIDAAADNERTSRLREAEAGGPEPEARAVNVTLRSSEHDHIRPDAIGQALRSLQDESFQEMDWIDEEDNEAYAAFHDHLFYEESGANHKLMSMISKIDYLDVLTASKVDNKSIAEMRVARQEKAKVNRDWDVTTDEEEDREVL